MNRNQRIQIASETVSIIEKGHYVAGGGKKVDIAESIKRSVKETKLYTPQDFESLVCERSERKNVNTEFVVTNETTLDAAHRLVVEQGKLNVLCLNFASAKNPGGGFLSGSQAQEESLARSSALYGTLQAALTYYDLNRKCGTALYTDHMILSPRVPVFRDDSGRLLAEPYPCWILTAPAVNAGAVRKNELRNVSLIRETMARRVKMVLAVAVKAESEHLVLGAWGCGVFKNDPKNIAHLFANELTKSGTFANCFETVVFAVLDRSEEKIIGPFRQMFSLARLCK